ncbi:hypothetical protein B0J13DRAFT_156724 [Dactylonectria estremocensis]|uniref:Uncharacterized protein n=1 Tax=Dactylonectria estremocensis TaxID=1079267 RepID=A0A9P9IJ51_9HYPO|nr:hypothetical protein B0J13DRAFT_156724 [Dactylonectria estremocensis]
MALVTPCPVPRCHAYSCIRHPPKSLDRTAARGAKGLARDVLIHTLHSLTRKASRAKLKEGRIVVGHLIPLGYTSNSGSPHGRIRGTYSFENKTKRHERPPSSRYLAWCDWPISTTRHAIFFNRFFFHANDTLLTKNLAETRRRGWPSSSTRGTRPSGTVRGTFEAQSITIGLHSNTQPFNCNNQPYKAASREAEAITLIDIPNTLPNGSRSSPQVLGD